MSFHQKLSCFTNNSNSNNKSKEAKESNKSKNIQAWRNTISCVIKVNKMMSKNANYVAPELENLNSLEKIIKLQEDLKIVAYIKQQYEGKQKKMIEKMNKNNSYYYKKKKKIK